MRHRTDEIMSEARELGELLSLKEIESRAMSEAYEFDAGSSRGDVARMCLLLIECYEQLREAARECRRWRNTEGANEAAAQSKLFGLVSDEAEGKSPQL